MITSKDNKLIKLFKSVKEKKFSRKNNLCMVETYKVVHDLYVEHMITKILVTEKSYHMVEDFKVPVEIISNNLCEYLTDATTSDGVIALCKIPKICEVDYSRCLILDGIQDPSNLGAILRSACAFGYRTIFAIDSVYPYTYKCIRASMSYIFKCNYIDININDLLDTKKSKNIDFIVADMNGETIENINVCNRNIGIVIGNEGQGVSDILKNNATQIVSIPMDNNVESLNASVSAGIIMYLLKRGK